MNAAYLHSAVKWLILLIYSQKTIKVNQIKFPVILFEKNNYKIHSLDYKFLKGDLRFEHIAFRNVELIDSDGYSMVLKGVKRDGGILLLDSLKLVGLIVKFNPIVEGEIKKISLEELKIKVKDRIHRNKKYWKMLDDGRGIDTIIDETQSFKELILIFK